MMNKIYLKIVLSIIAGFILSEISLRIVWTGPKLEKPVEWRPIWVPSGADFAQASLYTPDSILGWKHRPNSQAFLERPCFSTTVAFNYDGTRDEKEDLLWPDGLFIGDSFFEGLQVGNKYLLDEQLERITGGKYINFGVAGYGPDQYFQVYKNWINSNPDKKRLLAVVGIYLGNDLRNLSRELEEKANGRRSPKSFILNDPYKGPVNSYVEISTPWWKKLGRYFYIYHLIGIMLHKFGILKYELPVDYYLYLYPPYQAWEKSWLVMDKILDDFKKETNLRGDKLLIVLIETAPSRLRRVILRQFSIPPQKSFSLSYPRNRLIHMLNEKEIKFVDLYESIISQVNSHGFYSVYLKCDSHWGPKGHELAAKEIAKVVYEWDANRR